MLYEIFIPPLNFSVDRLIKASKANNPKRRSLLSGSNQGSPVLSGSYHALDQLVFSNSKLNLAQTELQACETHLTEKERMLAQMRESCIAGGLKMRCRALSECGLKWSEVGRIGLQALESTNSRGSFGESHVPSECFIRIPTVLSVKHIRHPISLRLGFVCLVRG